MKEEEWRLLERSSLIYNALGVNVVMTVQRRDWNVKEERMGVSGGAVRYRVFWMFIHASGLSVATRLQGAITGINSDWTTGLQYGRYISFQDC